MRYRSEWIVVISLVAGAGCGGGDIAAPTERALQPSFNYAGGAETCGYFSYNPSAVPSPWSDGHPWPCGSEIQVDTSGTGNVAALKSAIQAWNGAFSAIAGMPKFVYQTRTYSLKISGSTSSPVKGCTGPVSGCGPGSPSSDWQIRLSDGSGIGSGSASAVALHELGHVMGLGNAAWDKDSSAYPSASRHCSFTPSGPGQTYTTTTLCQHLVEGFLFFNGVRATPPNLSKHIVTGLRTATNGTLPVSLALTSGASSSVDAAKLSFARANPAFCASLPDEGCIAVAPSNSIEWHSTAGGIISVANSGNGATLTAVAPGTATVYATISSSSYELSSLLSGIAVTVTPAPPPPPSGITATSITSSSATINWTNGNSSATTVIEYQRSGDATWAQISAAAGLTSKTLTGLVAASTYSVRLHHVLGGVSSTTVTALNLFQTSQIPLEIYLVGDHDPVDEVGSYQSCRWKAFSNVPGTVWSWGSDILTRSVKGFDFTISVTGTVGGQSKSLSMLVHVSDDGPECGAW